MRPRGGIRQALGAAADRLIQQRGCFTCPVVAAAAFVQPEAARLTINDMVRAGELIVIGHTRQPGVNRPLNLYARPQRAQGEPSAFDALARCWADFK